MTETTDLKAGQRMVWFYVGRLHETTTVEKVKEHVQKKRVNGDIECEIIKTPGRLKAFKLGIPHESIEVVNKAEAWPTGVLVKKYIFRGNRPEGAQL
ncbi:hypothetical protein C0J52_21058 [Blattella germanica]|nr:hypothetical protein C0J52_21058 [Blattella germanica]